MNLTKNLGLKPTLLYKDEKEMVPFKSVVVPSSMRSPLWKYFGFPANENREIITRTKIICCICYQHVAYNKNTTNLSAHLNNKHPEVLDDINKCRVVKKKSESECSSPKRFKTKEDASVDWHSNCESQNSSDGDKKYSHPTGITRKTCAKGKKTIYKPKFQITEDISDLDDSQKSSDDHIDDETTEHENQFIETINYANIDIHEEGNEIIAEVLESDSVTNTDRLKDQFLSAQFITINENNEVLYETPSEKIILSPKSPIKVTENVIEKCDSTDVMNQIKNFLIKDLISSNIIDGTGFKEMITFFTQNPEIPSSLEIEKSLDKDYNLQHIKAISDIKGIIDNRSYALLFHKLGNSSMVEITVNYWLDCGDRISSLENQMFCISKNCTNFIISFGESLSNCSAFIADFDLESEFDGNIPRNLISEIPILPTFSFVTKLAFEACMQLSAVQAAVFSADGILGGKVRTSHTWLQKFECLSQFLNEPDNIENSQIIQVAIRCLQPLKNCLDVLAFETSAYASIMKPVALQLINQHYGDDASIESTESDIAVLEKDLRQTILKVFQQNIIESPFLTMASFLDPRFQRLAASDDLKLIRNELEKNIHNDDTISSERVSSTKEEKQLKSRNEKNLGLSTLFSNLSTPIKPKPPKNRFDIDFRSYTEDVSLDMELCPLEWWMENESLYPSIKQHVKKYFCVPSFVNNSHRLPLHDQEELEQKYERLESVDASEKLLWLHLNELRQRSCDT